MTGEPTTIYNSTDGPLPYDRAGRMVPARERLRVPAVDGTPAKSHVDAGRFIVVEPRDDDPIAPALEEDDVTEQPETSAKLEDGAEVGEVTTLEQPAGDADDEATPQDQPAADVPADAAPTTPARRKRGGQ